MMGRAGESRQRTLEQERTALKPNLQFISQRAELLREIRSFFDHRGFLEVQPPCISRDCVVDAYIDPITIALDQFGLPLDDSLDDPTGERYLQTSPELAMKRMLAAGSPSIYSLGPVFRRGERGQWHNPEFTMLEWYQVGADLNQGVDLLGTLVSQVLGQEGYQRCTYRDLFRQSIGIDPIDGTLADLQAVVGALDANLCDRAAEDRDLLLDIILSERIQSSLGHQRPQLVTDYPLSQAALAKTSVDDPMCAARFELFASGVEIANGYDELLDPEVLLVRARENNRKRTAQSKRPLKIETSLVRAMRDGVPPSAGVALGVDRLLMVRVGAESIDQVIPLPFEIA